MNFMETARWENAKGPYASGRVLVMGPASLIKVGSAGFDGCTSSGDTKKYAARCCMPGYKTDLGHFETQEEAEAKVWQVVEKWFNVVLMVKE